MATKSPMWKNCHNGIVARLATKLVLKVKSGIVNAARSSPKASGSAISAGLEGDPRPSAGTCGCTWGNDAGLCPRSEPVSGMPFPAKPRPFVPRSCHDLERTGLAGKGPHFSANFCTNKEAPALLMRERKRDCAGACRLRLQLSYRIMCLSI